MTTPKLEPGTPLPCPNPWCGPESTAVTSIVEKFWTGPSHTHFEMFRGKCLRCGIVGPRAKTEAEALAAWNTRHPDPRQQEKIEALVKALEWSSAFVRDHHTAKSERDTLDIILDAITLAEAK